VAHSLTLLFVSTYTTSWTSFFNDFIALIQANTRQGQTFDYFTAQIFVKILSMIDQEVADMVYTSSKKPGDHRMNTDIKDRIREYDVGTISRFLFEVMTAFQGETELEGLVGQCLSVIGQWIGTVHLSTFDRIY
jgi:exportin-T